MGDEKALPPSKKRAAGREISKDDPGLDDDEDVSEQETGTFKKASNEVLASRRIVKVRRQPASAATSAPTSNPFAGIRLVPPVSTTAADESKNELLAQAPVEEKSVDVEDKKDNPDEEHKLNENELEEKTGKAVNESSADEEKLDTAEKDTCEETPVDKDEPDQRLVKEAEDIAADKSDLKTSTEEVDEPKASDGQVQTEVENTLNGDNKENGNEKEKDNNNSGAGADATTLSSFQQLSSSKNAFTGLASTGFSSSVFSFGSISKDGSPSGSGFAFGSKTDQPTLPSFGFAASNNGSTPMFGATGGSGSKSEVAAFPSMPEVPVETGEENEETVFTADSALFEFTEGGWKERGKGEVKVNLSDSGGRKARLVMRARGNYRLILNAYLYPDMKLTEMDKKGITFACANSASERKTGLVTFALKFKEASIVETFSATVTAHKGEAGKSISTPVLKAPENSPRAAED